MSEPFDWPAFLAGPSRAARVWRTEDLPEEARAALGVDPEHRWVLAYGLQADGDADASYYAAKSIARAVGPGTWSTPRGPDGRHLGVGASFILVEHATHVFDDGTTLAEIERRVIEDTLRWRGGNKAATARELGISRRSLYDKLERYAWDDREARRKRARGKI